MVFSFPSLARKVRMWKILLARWGNGPLFVSIVKLVFLTCRVWGPDGTNAVLELNAGLNVKHLLYPLVKCSTPLGAF